jgi:isoleucyl-tRNA synthetase
MEARVKNMTTDYKKTLNLPQTGFAMKADLVAREPQRLQQWQKAALYAQIRAARAGAQRFVLHDGPPFANGDVHIGTALNKILKDFIVKHQGLLGRDAPYVPGWDCHGLPIEFKVTQDMRKDFERQWSQTRKQHEDLWKDKTDPAAIEAGIKQLEQHQFLSPEKVRAKCEEYAKHFIEVQRGQFKRLGVLGDWETPYLTLDKKYEADELRLFADIVEKGFVYRAKKPVYWCIPCRTALAEAEVEYHEHVSQSVYVKFRLMDQHQTQDPVQQPAFVLVWTTTPWTLPANLAVAYNSKLQYSLVRVGTEYYWLLSSLVDTVAQKCKWQSFQTVKTALGAALLRQVYKHPFCNREGKLYAGDSFVESSTGTGFVHIAPGHGLDDYNFGRQHGLPIYSPVTDDGFFKHTEDLPDDAQLPIAMFNKSILAKHGKSEANEAVLHQLRAHDALLYEEDYPHSYPHCWRSKNPVIFRAMDQWIRTIKAPCSLTSKHSKPASRWELSDDTL